MDMIVEWIEIAVNDRRKTLEPKDRARVVSVYSNKNVRKLEYGIVSEEYSV